MFPDHLQKNLPNLVLFVLKHTARSVKLRTSLEICSTSCRHSNLNYSLTALRTLSRDIKKLQLQILNTEQLIVAYDGDPELSFTVLRLRKKVKILSLLLSRKHFQEKNIRAVHSAFKHQLSQQKISTVLKNHHVHKMQFKKFLEQSVIQVNDQDSK